MYVQLQEICLLVRLKEHTFNTFYFLFELQSTRRTTQTSRYNHTLPSVSVNSLWVIYFCRGLPIFFHDNSTIPVVGSGTRLPATSTDVYTYAGSSPSCLPVCCAVAAAFVPLKNVNITRYWQFQNILLRVTTSVLNVSRASKRLPLLSIYLFYCRTVRSRTYDT